MSSSRVVTARVLVVSGLAGLVVGQLMPRGPVVPVQVPLAVVIGGLLGAWAGSQTGSRWFALLTPAAYALGYEVGRWQVVGPSVDRPRLGNELGVLVFVLGRGFTALLVLLPITLGALYGAAWRRRRDRDHDVSRWAKVRRAARVGATAAATVGLLALVAVLIRPGHTATITGPGGRPVPGSVAELVTVRLGGHDQKVLIRARSADKPVLLYLAGGPGQSDLGYTRAYMPTMEDDVVFAVWDQRGTGTSYAALDPTSSWTLDQAVSDTVELSLWLADRFHQKQIYLFGNSWGSIIGVLAAQRHPELYAAYIGAGQMVDPLETDEQIYRDMQALATRTQDVALARRLRASGSPPYRDVYAYATQIQQYDRIAAYPKTTWFRTHGPTGIDGNGASEYGPLDKVNKLKALFDMGSVMYPQLQDVDLRRDVASLSTPVYLVQGAHELSARTVPAREWFQQLRAPDKEWITFPESGHIPQFEEFDSFRGVIARVVSETSAP
jgi:pimeloyl-ACP methyl ester carboxylesterase